MDMEKLPGEITMEIFSRLPPESVVRCKFVCKSWHSLLPRGHGDEDGNYFAKMHLHQQRNNNLDLKVAALHEFIISGKRGRIIVVGEFHITELHYDDNNEEHMNKFKFNYKQHMKRVNFPQIRIRSSPNIIRTSLVGSCNGLLCLRIRWKSDSKTLERKQRIGICNPLLNEYVLLPVSVSDLPNTIWYRGTKFIGFGYHPITDEYKVVRINYRRANPDIGEVEVYTLGNHRRANADTGDVEVHTPGDVEVHTLGKHRRANADTGDVEVHTLGKGNGMWRHIGTIKYMVWSNSVFVNGSIHWLTENPVQILSFDLEVEEFHEISLPHIPCFDEVPMDLKELGGRLSFVRQGLREMEIWVLKDYMNKESWVKEFSITTEGICQCSPCAVMKKKNGGHDQLLLWSNKQELVSYDPKTQTVEHVGGGREVYVNKSPLLSHKVPVLHINSFISLKALGEDPKLYRKSSININIGAWKRQ